MEHQKFSFSSLEEIENKCNELCITIPFSKNIDLLKQPLTINGCKAANRIAIQPMEGCDGTKDGSPDLLTKRRYHRFAESSAGLLWFEAVAVCEEGRANPRQLMLTERNLDEYKKLVEEIKTISLRENGIEPIIIMQATHSGRYSKPHGKPEPIIAYHSPIYEKENPIDDSHIITDSHLKELEKLYGISARLAEKAGFDGVDVKACHRYLLCELLSAYQRSGEYGGSFENRTKMLLNCIKSAQAAVSSHLLVTSRLNVYDGAPYPYGFGVNQTGSLNPDMGEPIRLVEILHKQLNIPLLDLTIGNPYFNPHVNRPFDMGAYVPNEHPLEGVARICHCTGEIAKKFPDLNVISSGNSYLRQFAANLAAGMVEQGWTTMVGFGREAFAYPTFARDLLNHGAMDPKKCCISCSKCTELMRAGSTAGCVIRDPEYTSIYKKDVLKKQIQFDHP